MFSLSASKSRAGRGVHLQYAFEEDSSAEEGEGNARSSLRKGGGMSNERLVSQAGSVTQGKVQARDHSGSRAGMFGE